MDEYKQAVLGLVKTGYNRKLDKYIAVSFKMTSRSYEWLIFNERANHSKDWDAKPTA